MITATAHNKYVLFKWGQHCAGYMFDWTSSGFANRHEFFNSQDIYAAINMGGFITVIDPLTALALNLVTPEMLGYPPGVLAAFQLLRGNS